MNELKLKTNIKCTGCEEKVKPHLDKLEGVLNWKVDLDSPEKVLLVELDGANELDIVEALNKAGYTGEAMK